MAQQPVCPRQVAEGELLRLNNRVRFILAVVGGKLVIAKRKKGDIEAQLEAEGYDRLAPVRRQKVIV
jgi:DNA topoisomerase II